MPGLVVDAIAKRDVQLPYVRLFLSITDGFRGIPDLSTDQIQIEALETGSPLAVAAIYPEAFFPGKYIAVLHPTDQPQPTGRSTGHNGEIIFKINVRHPGSNQPVADGADGQTVVYLPSRDEGSDDREN